MIAGIPIVGYYFDPIALVLAGFNELFGMNPSLYIKKGN